MRCATRLSRIAMAAILLFGATRADAAHLNITDPTASDTPPPDSDTPFAVTNNFTATNPDLNIDSGMIEFYLRDSDNDTVFVPDDWDSEAGLLTIEYEGIIEIPNRWGTYTFHTSCLSVDGTMTYHDYVTFTTSD